MRVPHVLLNILTLLRFPGSSRYWELRYRVGGNSGAGSYGSDALYKSDFLNHCFATHDVESVVDFGCGDGSQLSRLNIAKYQGYDVSESALALCRKRYAGDSSKKFYRVDEYAGETADAALSLDVLYHLVEDDVFDEYLSRLFYTEAKIIVIYAINLDETRKFRGRHVRCRRFTERISINYPAYQLIHAPVRPSNLSGDGISGASFFVFQRQSRR